MKNRPRVPASSPRHSIVRALLALGLLPNCGAPAQPSATGAKGAEPSSSAAPFDLQATIKREATDLSEHLVQGPGAAWTAKVPAAADPELDSKAASGVVAVAERVTSVEIPIGSESAVTCQVFFEALDPGGTLFGVLDEGADAVEFRSITPSGVRLIAGMPTAFVDTLYVADVKAGKAAGGLKLAIQARAQETLLCLHDELGYKRTFERVSSAFFSSFELRGASPDVDTYSEVSRFRLGETDIGFSWTRVKPGPKPGERELDYLNTKFMPLSLTDVVFQDDYELYVYNAKNELQTGTWVESSSGQVTLKFGLKRSADGKFAYEGEAGGKALKGLLQAPHGVLTPLEVAARLKKKLKTGGPFELVVGEYHPSVDPTAALDVIYRHQQGDPARQVLVTMRDHTISDRVLTTDVDDDGMPTTTWYPFGKQRLTIERLRREGHL